jgi:hypothetical protein
MPARADAARITSGVIISVAIAAATPLGTPLVLFRPGAEARPCRNGASIAPVKSDQLC